MFNKRRIKCSLFLLKKKVDDSSYKEREEFDAENRFEYVAMCGYENSK